MTKKIKLSSPEELIAGPLEAATSVEIQGEGEEEEETVAQVAAAEVTAANEEEESTEGGGGSTRSGRRLSRRVATYAEGGGKRRRTRKSSILGTLFSPVYQFYQTISGHPTGEGFFPCFDGSRK